MAKETKEMNSQTERCKACDQLMQDCICSYPHKHKMIKPKQPIEEDGQPHDTKCPCHECETWAWALLDWEEKERNTQ